jgi:hypothetical protein
VTAYVFHENPITRERCKHRIRRVTEHHALVDEWCMNGPAGPEEQFALSALAKGVKRRGTTFYSSARKDRRPRVERIDAPCVADRHEPVSVYGSARVVTAEGLTSALWAVWTDGSNTNGAPTAYGWVASGHPELDAFDAVWTALRWIRDVRVARCDNDAVAVLAEVLRKIGAWPSARTHCRRSSTTPDWSYVLGVAIPCTRDDVVRAFRKLALETHPDRGGDPARFIAVRTAYDQALAAVG